MDRSLARAGPRPLITFDGGAGALMRLHIGNIFLTLLTLGIYRFWAKTRIRRYFWSHSRFEGDRIEYTGTGGELLRGFLLIVILVLVPLFGALAAIQIWLEATAPELAPIVAPVQLLLILYLTPVALYRARRYRLSRSQWRGVRGGQTGSGWVYGAKSLAAYVLAVLSLGLAWPALGVWLARYRISNTWFGDRQLTFEGRAGPLYKTFFAVIAVSLVLAAAVAAVIAAVVPEGSLENAGERMQQTQSIEGLVVFLPLLLLGFLALPWYWYRAKLYRCLAEWTRVDDLHFEAEVTGASLLWLSLGNMAIVVVTLGLGAPLVYLRRARYIARRLDVRGTMDFDAVVQGSLARPSTGEGLADALDAGGI